MKSDAKNGVHLFFDNPEATYIPYDVIRSYDRPLIMGDFTARMADKNVKSELDWQLYLLQRRYLDYQVNIGNKMIEMLSSNDEEQRNKAATLSLAKRRFQDMIDDVNHDSFFGSSQFHDLYQSSRRGFAGLHGPSANSREASAPLRSVCDSCKSRFAAVSAFHSSVIVR